MHDTNDPASAVASAALDAVIPTYMSATSAALYARWWQFETWLRELVYVEMRARYGIAWVNHVLNALKRQEPDALFTHLAGADTANPLAYLDYSQLLEVIQANWDMFSPVLIEQESWQGRQPD